MGGGCTVIIYVVYNGFQRRKSNADSITEHHKMIIIKTMWGGGHATTFNIAKNFT